MRNGFKAHRWIVELVHSWFNRLRKLLVRYEKTYRAYESLLQLAAIIIIFRKLVIISGYILRCSMCCPLTNTVNRILCISERLCKCHDREGKTWSEKCCVNTHCFPVVSFPIPHRHSGRSVREAWNPSVFFLMADSNSALEQLVSVLQRAKSKHLKSFFEWKISWFTHEFRISASMTVLLSALKAARDGPVPFSFADPSSSRSRKTR